MPSLDKSRCWADVQINATNRFQMRSEIAMALPQSIHPFPARMAPEIALKTCSQLSKNSVVLDPMAGSGTVLRMAAEHGLSSLGFDLDPLAVMMSRVWTTPIDSQALVKEARLLIDEVRGLTDHDCVLPWIDEDKSTQNFIEFWFEPKQKEELRRLALGLSSRTGPFADALRIALSRIIITKDRGASLARDASHSRPHRQFSNNDFQVLEQFLKSTRQVGQRLESLGNCADVSVSIGDARKLSAIDDGSIDAVITSPPYLNAIDYMRGHKLSLVWLGYRIGELATVRSQSVGAERALDRSSHVGELAELSRKLGSIDDLPPRFGRIAERYISDLWCIMFEIRRVLKQGGIATLVVGNCCIRGVFIDNAAAVNAIAGRVGLTLVGRTDRELPANRRYLPPPAAEDRSSLTKRMRTEAVLRFAG